MSSTLTLADYYEIVKKSSLKNKGKIENVNK